ncbi:hypothetical protein [Pseudoalteromonas luteoviolacea]|uniref:Uncharacterized protein n=1 Tax=Pseudoalteromonas luteoviolacea S4054 TaxID=1129367 RepID=A0A0F6AHP3_9GAMM|nr:hypothetical protein [Pseudoalteromonas luteoviolacea]AOT07714.1 hypothetical protein S4054249_07585 [Pseudoalteromonas luteoviolacea]AOT12630.1 hypothetical protein S40542_07585 [Pseudoalteromonas luteoviolacea]AOT17544.1 hypothetical protein S4054_07585 [Pseudoalteromonas luteoviolacea]KKE85737.1 hypothetical protein N479_24860 [Pseudoalteromonas luteoviolacea S4054]KZN61810.1 hypothetical protein N481_25800 [Pseudoalteromonas luteoviolacea S4047-1]
MASLLEQLLHSGFCFTDKKKEVLKRELFPGFIWEVSLEDDTWEELYEVGFCIWSPLFGKLMTILFTEHKTLANEYHRRALIDDNKGCISFSSVAWEEAPTGQMELYSAATYLSLNEFLTKLESAKEAKDIYSLIYEYPVSKFVPPSELLWVYLYLLKEMGLSNLEILDKLASEQENFPAKTLKPVDLTLLEAFEMSYNKAREQ